MNELNLYPSMGFQKFDSRLSERAGYEPHELVQLLKIIKQLNDGHMEGTDVTIHMSFLFWEIPAYVFFIFCQKLKTC